MNIIISGITCSGKTTLSNEILTLNDSTCILREDDYMKDLCDIPHKGKYYLMDLPSAYKTREFEIDVNKLLNGELTFYPQYDVFKNKRINKKLIKSKKDVNIFEGLHTIDILKDLRDSIKVFMDTDLDTCLERRIMRDTSLYNVREEDVRRYFNEIIISIYKTHIEKQKYMSDVIIRSEEDKKCLLKRLQTY